MQKHKVKEYNKQVGTWILFYFTHGCLRDKEANRQKLVLNYLKTVCLIEKLLDFRPQTLSHVFSRPSSNHGPTMLWWTKIEPVDIPSQQCENVFDQHDPAYKICILVSVKHFSPTKDL